MPNFSWLHLSDWHQRGEDFDRTVVRDALLQDLRSRRDIDPRLAQVAFVVFSGDAAFGGSTAEFEAARRNLFDPVLSAIGLEARHLFLVPGNHDLNRDVVREMLPEELQKPFASDEQVKNWLTAEKKRTRALEPFEDYSRFVAGYTGQDSPDFAAVQRVTLDGLEVALLGLNSAWTCGRNKNEQGEVNDYGFLAVGEPQIHSALASLADADVRIAVVHHPFAWLQGFERSLIEERLKEVCHFILRGHEHEPNFDLTSGLQGPCAVIPAGACYDRRRANNPRYVNAYNFVHVDLATRKGAIFFRRWSERQTKWIADTDTCSGGQRKFTLPKKLGQRPRSTAGSPRGSVPKAVAAYVTRLADETSRLKLLGLGRSLQIELPITDAYVPLRTTLTRSLEERGARADSFKGQHAEVTQDVDLGDVFQHTARLGQRGIVLLGEPGSGKTTGARQIAWRLASRQTAPEQLGLPAGITPVFLRFRALSRAALAERNGLKTFLLQETAHAAGPDDLAAAGDDLWNGRGGKLLWILDGLDEVIDPGARRTVSHWIQEALDGRPGDWFLVTCRFAGYFLREGVPLGPKFVRFDVRPLNDEQVARFVRDWFAAAYRRLLHPPALAADRAAKLLEVLSRPAYQAGHIRELCTNPLLLTILCIVFHDEQKLPTSRAELYAHCVRVLLQHWRREIYESDVGRGIQPFDADAAQAVLGRVAWWMHGEQDRTAAPLDDLAQEAERGLAEVAASSGLGRDGRAFIERMRDETGVLASEGDGRCGFLHLSFQEYLAAHHAAHEGKAPELALRAADSWWREVALLSLRHTRPFCEAFFQALLAAGIVEQHPDLADRCLTETLFFSPRPFLDALAQSDSPRRVAAVLRLLRERGPQIPELEPIARRLATAPDPETVNFAREILLRLGITLPSGAGEVRALLDATTGLTFVPVPAGEFEMGSERGHEDEQPIHPVRITQGFWLGTSPVTNAQYDRFLKAACGSAAKPAYWDDRRFNQPEQPVVGVSWQDAQAYCAWAGCRLPTEAEWEYACRAGTTTEYSFGDDPAALGDYAWFAENSGGQTQPVGTKKPNPWGLHDMYGNVWEWCQDWFGSDYYHTSPTTDPAGPDSGAGRVVRGGSWYGRPRYCRSAIRYDNLPDYRVNDLGFRAART
jgi:formylglycine-generating enzyme required for sulfatase activity